MQTVVAKSSARAIKLEVREAPAEVLERMTLEEKWSRVDQLLSTRLLVAFDRQSAIIKLIESDPQAMLRRIAERGALVRLIDRVEDHPRRLLPFQIVFSFPRVTLDQSELWSRRLKPMLVQAAKRDPLIADMALGGEHRVAGPNGTGTGTARFKELAAALGAKSRPTVDLAKDAYER
jgi:hypothetical protein